VRTELGLGILFAATALSAAPAEKNFLNETREQHETRLRWWRDARFGIFIHWGPVSLKGTEISWSRANSNPACPNRGKIPVEEYDSLYKQFNPTNFNAREWADIAKSAGAKYIILTAKHCDGFCLWPTKVSDYHIGSTPFGRDVCGELASAVHKTGLQMGWYYSAPDWRDPDVRTEHNDRYVARMQTHLRKLLSNYGRIGQLWFDADAGPVPWDQDNTYRIVRTLQPRIIIDDRLDWGTNRVLWVVIGGDYTTPEQRVGAYNDQTPWESCITLGTQWSWKPDDQIKSLKECIRLLARCAGGDGNLMLNTGPMPDGRIEPRQAERLKEIGGWLKKYGQSIYGTRGGPWKPGANAVSTRKGKTVFVHIFESADSLKLPPIPAKVVRSRVLTGGQAKVNQSEAGVQIVLPPEARQEIDTIIALTLDSDARRIPAIAGASSGSLTAHAKVTASNVCQNLPECDPKFAVDDNAETRWATDANVKQAWLEVDLGKARRFDRALITEAFQTRVKKFELQYRSGDDWKTFSEGTTIGNQWSRRFDAVTAQRVRLNILDAVVGPTIWEFQLFEAAN